MGAPSRASSSADADFFLLQSGRAQSRPLFCAGRSMTTTRRGARFPLPARAQYTPAMNHPLAAVATIVSNHPA